jgi:hypothetical protein
MNGGDQLARGQKTAQFPASDGNVSQKKWDEAFADYTPPQPHEEKQSSTVVIPT